MDGHQAYVHGREVRVLSILQKNNINTKQMKKEYKKPQIKEYELQNTTIICGSPENYSEYISGPGDWGDDPIIDPDDEIDW